MHERLIGRVRGEGEMNVALWCLWSPTTIRGPWERGSTPVQEPNRPAEAPPEPGPDQRPPVPVVDPPAEDPLLPAPGRRDPSPGELPRRDPPPAEPERRDPPLQEDQPSPVQDPLPMQMRHTRWLT